MTRRPLAIIAAAEGAFIAFVALLAYVFGWEAELVALITAVGAAGAVFVGTVVGEAKVTPVADPRLPDDAVQRLAARLEHPSGQ